MACENFPSDILANMCYTNLDVASPTRIVYWIILWKKNYIFICRDQQLQQLKLGILKM